MAATGDFNATGGFNENALKILTARDARGEVDDETYRKMKDEIRQP